ncbi:MAG: amidohydrolase family protein, partial [Solobacterium sp.]|nr:amidohydrolase family protein [Solobacterium sp.]
NSLGLTSLSDMNGYYFNDFSENLYGMAQTLEKEGDMTVRLHIYPELAADRSNEKALELKKRINSEVVRISGLKGFLDGVAATYTALLIDPYTDRPDTCGIDVPKVTVEELEEYVLRSNKSGLSVRLHAIGDGAVRMALDAFEKSKKAGYTDGVVNVIEHIEEILPEDIPRFKEIGVVGCMQPAHLLLDYEEKPVRVGDRAKLMWAHRTLLDAGMDLAFSTDFPIIPLGPYRDLYVATTRKTESGEDTGTNQEEEKITLEEAITAYTKTSAKAIGRDDIGVLKEGNLADIVIHDRDLFACDLDDIKDVRPFMTIMDGKVVYKK